MTEKLTAVERERERERERENFISNSQSRSPIVQVFKTDENNINVSKVSNKITFLLPGDDPESKPFDSKKCIL